MLKYDSEPLSFSPSILLLLQLSFLLLLLFTMRMYGSVVFCTDDCHFIFNDERVTIACHRTVVTVRTHRGTVGLSRLITAAMDR